MSMERLQSSPAGKSLVSSLSLPVPQRAALSLQEGGGGGFDDYGGELSIHNVDFAINGAEPPVVAR